MSYYKKIEYEIIPKEAFQIARNCSGCGEKMAYQSTGNFRVNANGNQLDVSFEDASISSAVMRVMRHSTNTTIIEQTIYDETTEYIPESGVYTLEIETAGGTLVGQFNVR